MGQGQGKPGEEAGALGATEGGGLETSNAVIREVEEEDGGWVYMSTCIDMRVLFLWVNRSIGRSCVSLPN